MAYFDSIEDRKTAIRLAKRGSIGGFIFAATYALAIGLVLFMGRNPTLGDEIVIENHTIELIVYTIFFVIILLLSWRIRTAYGWVSAILLLLLYLYELFSKILLNGWLGIVNIISIVTLFLIIAAVRGTWAYRKHKNDPDIDVFD